MKGLDTNVLVRYLVRDEKFQAEKASTFIQQTISKGESLLINSIVVCELVWVLEFCYKFKKTQIISVLEKILVTKQFEFEEKDLLRQSVFDYSQGKGDLADYLIGRINREIGCERTATFDRALEPSPMFELL